MYLKFDLLECPRLKLSETLNSAQYLLWHKVRDGYLTVIQRGILHTFIRQLSIRWTSWWTPLHGWMQVPRSFTLSPWPSEASSPSQATTLCSKYTEYHSLSLSPYSKLQYHSVSQYIKQKSHSVMSLLKLQLPFSNLQYLTKTLWYIKLPLPFTKFQN